MKTRLLALGDFDMLTGASDYPYDLDENAAEVTLSFDIRSPLERVTVYLEGPLDGGKRERLPLCSGEYLASQNLRVVGYDRLVIRCSPANELAALVQVKAGHREDRLDPTPIALIPPNRDETDLARMIAIAVDRSLSRRDPSRNKFDLLADDNNLDFDHDDADELGEGYMEPDADMVERTRKSRAKAPAKPKGSPGDPKAGEPVPADPAAAAVPKAP